MPITGPSIAGSEDFVWDTWGPIACCMAQRVEAVLRQREPRNGARPATSPTGTSARSPVIAIRPANAGSIQPRLALVGEPIAALMNLRTSEPQNPRTRP